MHEKATVGISSKHKQSVKELRCVWRVRIYCLRLSAEMAGGVRWWSLMCHDFQHQSTSPNAFLETLWTAVNCWEMTAQGTNRFPMVSKHSQNTCQLPNSAWIKPWICWIDIWQRANSDKVQRRMSPAARKESRKPPRRSRAPGSKRCKLCFHQEEHGMIMFHEKKWSDISDGFRLHFFHWKSLKFKTANMPALVGMDVRCAVYINTVSLAFQLEESSQIVQGAFSLLWSCTPCDCR